MPRVRVKVTAEPKIVDIRAQSPVQHMSTSVPPSPPSADIPETPLQQVPIPQAPIQQQQMQAKKKGVTLSFLSVVLVFAVFVIVLLFAVGMSMSRNDKPPDSTDTLGAATEQSEASRYHNEISKYVELPAEETPTVLNVSDAAEVKKDNAALTDIKNGDKMLFFTKARKLVVYRPSTKKVVAVVSLAVSANGVGSSQTQSQIQR